ncbi:uncharacterized protein LOC110465178 [Mizuhopecten yessoensis]|uniref:SEFIR domain-containing protein n=1 Tax=Mizuhopecten yessoensis TaxID=6573 RepID=A0A210PS28_MIZYE|nr:uncharacterized protein LOC110465178 [Mizuhopecten yessoensis]OWF39299.1 hypothetical protein KP79_PYT11760 [Mizuhopecten yessoensis]
MSSVSWFVVVFYAVIAQGINSSQPDGEAWGIRTCVIQDELKENDYGCQSQEIDTEDFTTVNGVSCTPEVHSVNIRHNRSDHGSVTVTFSMKTRSCHRNHNRSRGVVVKLELTGSNEVDYKIFSLITKNRLQSNNGVTSYTITLALPNIDALFIAEVYPIQPEKDGSSFIHPMSVGKSDRDNMSINKVYMYTPEVDYICKCGDIIVTTNNTISLNLCNYSAHLISSTVTRKGADSICTPTNESACEKNYSNLVDGNYTVLTSFKCKDDKPLECKKDVTIWTQKDDVKVIQADDIFDVNKVLMIAGISTGCVMAFVVVVTYGILKRRLHQSSNKHKRRELILKERNDIMLVYFSASGLKNNIGEFAETLKKATRLPVHFHDDEASQGQRFTNKFDWLDECVRNSSNFVFIASRDLYELLEKKCKGNANSTFNPTGNNEVEFSDEQAWLAGIPCYVMDRMRGKRFYGLKRSRCFIVSFKDDVNESKIDYAHKLSQLSVFQCKGTKLCYVSQKKPMTITGKFLYELHGNKRSRQININDLEKDEQEMLLPMEGIDEAIAIDV